MSPVWTCLAAILFVTNIQFVALEDESITVKEVDAPEQPIAIGNILVKFFTKNNMCVRLSYSDILWYYSCIESFVRLEFFF